ncbi:sigma-70 domain-containing protein, partial [Priestia megaterium]|uniref:sigma-70 domain-containing protein n=1 Tax=Priestia megaterium TaxID=1404 RepID=UPI0028FC2031
QPVTPPIPHQPRTIPIPLHILQTINKLIPLQRHLLQDLPPQPSPEQIPQHIDLTPQKLPQILKIPQQPLSLETPI